MSLCLCPCLSCYPESADRCSICVVLDFQWVAVRSNCSVISVSAVSSHGDFGHFLPRLTEWNGWKDVSVKPARKARPGITWMTDWLTDLCRSGITCSMDSWGGSGSWPCPCPSPCSCLAPCFISLSPLLLRSLTSSFWNRKMQICSNIA